MFSSEAALFSSEAAQLSGEGRDTVRKKLTRLCSLVHSGLCLVGWGGFG